MSIFLFALFAHAVVEDIPVAQVADTDSPLRVEQAWVREAPPGVTVMAAYALLCNDDKEALTLAALSSPAFERVEMHVTIETADAVRMERSNNIVIGPNDCVEFAPGGRHFMLFDPRERLSAGDNVEFTLRFANGKEMVLRMPVQKAGDMLNSHDHDGHH